MGWNGTKRNTGKCGERRKMREQKTIDTGTSVSGGSSSSSQGVKAEDKATKRTMKLDMHCHCTEGSIDAVVSLAETIERLDSYGYDGMLITDHNSLEAWNKLKKDKELNILLAESNIRVFRGVEYDTCNAGHILVILPEEANDFVYRFKGMRVQDLIKLVHKQGGLLGPAHPTHFGRLGIYNTKIGKTEIYRNFDFIEGYNASVGGNTEPEMVEIARLYNLPLLGGSDSHRLSGVGKGYTIIHLEGNYNNNNTDTNGRSKYINTTADLIECLKQRPKTEVGGHSTKQAMYRRHKILGNAVMYVCIASNKLKGKMNSKVFKEHLRERSEEVKQKALELQKNIESKGKEKGNGKSQNQNQNPK